MTIVVEYNEEGYYDAKNSTSGHHMEYFSKCWYQTCSDKEGTYLENEISCCTISDMIEAITKLKDPIEETSLFGENAKEYGTFAEPMCTVHVYDSTAVTDSQTAVLSVVADELGFILPQINLDQISFELVPAPMDTFTEYMHSKHEEGQKCVVSENAVSSKYGNILTRSEPAVYGLFTEVSQLISDEEDIQIKLCQLDELPEFMFSEWFGWNYDDGREDEIHSINTYFETCNMPLFSIGTDSGGVSKYSLVFFNGFSPETVRHSATRSRLWADKQEIWNYNIRVNHGSLNVEYHGYCMYGVDRYRNSTKRSYVHHNWIQPNIISCCTHFTNFEDSVLCRKKTYASNSEAVSSGEYISELDTKKLENCVGRNSESFKIPLDIQYLKFCINTCSLSKSKLVKLAWKCFVLPEYFYSWQRSIDLRQSCEILVYPVLQDYLVRIANGPALRPGEEFCCEAIRLESFQKFPRWAPVSAVKLAKCGLSFTGHGDEVLCFSCAGRLRSWHYGDEPNVRHRQTFPNCNFMNGRDTSNIPLGGSSNQSVDVNDFDVPPLDSRSGSNPHNYYNGLARNTGNTSVRDEDDPLRAEELRMKIQRNRLQTYTGWPASAPVFPDELSRNGFYYTGVDDRVQCAFCRGIVRHWEPGDQVDTEHRHYFPDCGFVRAEDVGNVPLGSELSADSSEPVTVNINTGADILSDPQNAAILGINTDRSKNPFYALLQHRLGTYETWPITMRQRPEQLADAGFYYAGFSDNVKCFFCDGGLRNWEPDYDPWTEHARWFPRCGYVRREKGDHFIRGISEHYARFYPEETHAAEAEGPVVNITGPETQAALTNLPGVDYMVEPREIKARMDTDKVRTVLGMGYSRTVVRKALEIQLRTKGDDFPNAYSLLEAIFKLEANQGTAESSGVPSGASNVPEPTSKLTQSKETPKTKSQEKKETDNEEKEHESLESHSSDAESIVQENQKLKEERTCKICMDNNVNVVFLPCGHLVCCQECAQSLRLCPICRSTIRGTVKTYMS